MCIGKLCWRGECPFVRWIMSVCAVDNVRHVKTGEGENVRPVKKMRWQMTAYALFDEGENVRGGKCPVTHLPNRKIAQMRKVFFEELR